MKVIQNMVVVTGKYTTNDGQEKNRYMNVGRVLEDDKCGKMYVLDKTFNPAGINNGRDSVILNMFDIKDNQSQSQFEKQKPQQPVPVPDLGADLKDDEIPF